MIARLHIIGSKKASTSSLFKLFADGTTVCGSLEPSAQNKKEPAIWYRDVHTKTPGQYLDSWPQPGSKQTNCTEYMDANPVRLKDVSAAEALWRFAEASRSPTQLVRIVAVIREPISRQLSLYNHLLTQPPSTWEVKWACPEVEALPRMGLAPSFDELARCEMFEWLRYCGMQDFSAACYWARAWKTNPRGKAVGVMGSMYHLQLQQWERTWPRQQVLVVQFEMLVGMLQTLYTPWNGLLNRALAAAHKAGKAPPEELLFEIGASVVACSDEEGGRAQRALDLRELAQMYQVPRLELLCAQALQESVGPATAVPLLDVAHTLGDGRLLLAQCRRFVADHAAEVRASGGVEQLRDLGVAKGLLGDALDQVAELKGTVAARDVELEKVRAEVAERA
ncbi:hypothetical protein EMIHUDRAFT_208364 [Emiliania huxleyi CCMP1516]|uniref:Sulfotransferase domain-containing protein n=2 Tax=Emiliania huxleyi TaxID=2903 RepID=A0A0D3JAF2_EMIH1|nr:hypothetical protein EMIHUDRAFT_208364 [Emiliania huxleyi CCMP1516]EOD20487.1 hypothetical protein EMIHUDRAFT_208364 [Emiliania huxleyi CCMP1516]|eukprot:XP_005772916.1 hypothetical protein EMIHUDRAFT_208364 [Emiliania huxleyi CCMP1516]